MSPQVIWTNPGGFDYKKYLARKGASAVVFSQNANITKLRGRKEVFAIAAGLNVRNSIAKVIESSLPRQQAGLLNGMLIGYTDGLSEEVRNAFSNAGLSHIMAVSGANVVFIIIPIMLILKLLRLGKRLSNALVIAFLIFFVYITGFEPSVLRAVIMAIIILTGQIIRREADIYTSMAFSAILLLLISPHMLFNLPSAHFFEKKPLSVHYFITKCSSNPVFMRVLLPLRSLQALLVIKSKIMLQL